MGKKILNKQKDKTTTIKVWTQSGRLEDIKDYFRNFGLPTKSISHSLVIPIGEKRHSRVTIINEGLIPYFKNKGIEVETKVNYNWRASAVVADTYLWISSFNEGKDDDGNTIHYAEIEINSYSPEKREHYSKAQRVIRALMKDNLKLNYKCTEELTETKLCKISESSK